MSGPDDPAALSDILPVSRETADRLTAFVALLKKWQAAENLVSPKTLDETWSRHMADSAQLVALFPDTRRWLDIGSGAGFPGLVVAIAGPAGTRVGLVESNRRKCAFLRAAIRATQAPAAVHEGRAETIFRAWDTPVDRVISRAVAPLSTLLALAAPIMVGQATPAAFHKGRDYRDELRDATQSWSFDLVEHPSRIGGDGVILEISRLRPKNGTVPG